MTAQFHLYSMAVCPFAQRARIALRLKGVEFGLTQLEIRGPLPDWFLQLNPQGQVPVLLHEGRPLNESSVIVEYLEDILPSPRIFPADPYQRALARILIDYCNQQFVPKMYRLLMNQERDKDGELTQQALETWRWVNDFLVRHNPEGTWFSDEDGFGAADLSYAPFFMRYCLNSYYRYFEVPRDGHYDRVLRWRDALLAHPLVVETGMPEEHFIKLYYDYSLGYGNGEVPEGHTTSSFDLSVPLDQRPLPPRPARSEN